MNQWHKRLLACLLVPLLVAGCAQVPVAVPPAADGDVATPAPSLAPGTADSPGAPSPGVAASSVSEKPARQKIAAAWPTMEAQEIKDPLPNLRRLDLTASPDDLWERIRHGFAMPDLDSPLVLDRQIWYASRPSYIKRMVERSRRYLYHIVDELEKRGMPTELALLPMVESSFNPMAYSRAHASGLWQFIPSTGKNYNLQQNWWFDGRRDILASTTAALDYLQFLYEMHGDWQLALASYNWGENAVARAIEKNKARGLAADFSSLTVPVETSYYVPKLQALKNIIANPQAFGVDLDPIPNQPYFVTVSKTRDIDVRLAAKLAEMPVEELIALNPAYNRPVITAAQTQSMVLPADRVKIFQANLARHDKPLVSWQTYTLKSGDKLEKIAALHGITLARLRLVNGFGARSRVGAGDQLLLPIRGTNAAFEPMPAVFQPPPMPEQHLRKLTYVVKKGDTLASIAQRHRVNTDDLRRWNPIGRLATGQKLLIQVRAPALAAKKHQATAGAKRKARTLTASPRRSSHIAAR